MIHFCKKYRHECFKNPLLHKFIEIYINMSKLIKEKCLCVCLFAMAKKIYHPCKSENFGLKNGSPEIFEAN